MDVDVRDAVAVCGLLFGVAGQWRAQTERARAEGAAKQAHDDLERRHSELAREVREDHGKRLRKLELAGASGAFARAPRGADES